MQIAIGLYPEFTSLDALGPYQVLQHIPGAEVIFVAERVGELADDYGMLRMQIDATFAEVTTPDVLLVPGGIITRTLAHAGEPIVEWIRAAHPSTTWTTSVCTGALLLGAAGLLDGLEATTHWSAYDALAAFGATPTERRVVREGKIITGAGVSSGIDLAFTLAAEIAGADIARAIQLATEYDPQPPFDSGSPTKASTDTVGLVRSVMGQQAATGR